MLSDPYRAERSTTSTRQRQCAVIRAEIVDSNRCTAGGITATAHAPVLTLCRELLSAGFDPTAQIEAYRGPTLCLIVPTNKTGAALTMDERRKQKTKPFRF